MAARLLRIILAVLLVGTMGCVTPNPNVQVRRQPDGHLQVDGPLAGPYKTTQELAAAACELLTSQPGASSMHGKYGVEYCALYYYSREEMSYFLSYLSDVRREGPGGKKSCEVPNSINDPSRKNAIILGPGHSHPHNREFSPGDMGAGREEGWSPLGASKFFDKGTGRIWERELMVFYKERDGRCSVHRYNYATRVVSGLRNGEWVPIGKAEGEYGSLRRFEGQDWLP